jgi:hypothetical protein
MSDCPHCGSAADESATYCPNCGRTLAVETTQQSGQSRQHQPGQPRQQQSGHSEADTGSDAIRGLVAGLVSVVTGFLATFTFSNAADDLKRAEELLSSGGAPTGSTQSFLPAPYEIIAWEFLENHQVDVSAEVGSEVDTLVGAVGAESAVISEFTETLLPSSSSLQLLPPVLLGIAGFVVASRAVRTDLGDAAKAGAHVVLGYLPGIVAVVSVASYQLSVPVVDATLLEISPNVLSAIGIAGLAYPLVFGGLGGALAFLVEQS